MADLSGFYLRVPYGFAFSMNSDVECGAINDRREKHGNWKHLNKVKSFACDMCRG